MPEIVTGRDIQKYLKCTYKEALKLKRNLGSGIQGSVDLYCTDTKCNQQIAIKRSKIVPTPPNIIGNELMEVKVLEYLTSIPESYLFAKQYGWMICEDEVISFQKAYSYTLSDWAKEAKRTPQEWKKAILQVFEAIDYLEKDDITHMDVHDGNIFYDADLDRFVLGDFGLVFSRKHGFYVGHGIEDEEDVYMPRDWNQTLYIIMKVKFLGIIKFIVPEKLKKWLDRILPDNLYLQMLSTYTSTEKISQLLD